MQTSKGQDGSDIKRANITPLCLLWLQCCIGSLTERVDLNNLAFREQRFGACLPFLLFGLGGIFGGVEFEEVG